LSLSQKKMLCKVPIFFIHRLDSRKVYEKEKKKVGLPFKKNYDDVIVQKPIRSLKLGARCTSQDGILLNTVQSKSLSIKWVMTVETNAVGLQHIWRIFK
jgi:hypothetical protein